MDERQQVLQAAADLVAAFAANDRQAYFDAFSEDASFVFHNLDQRLADRESYRQLWDGWRADGFEVVSCVSSHPALTLLGDVAIFIHDVATTLRMQGELHHSQERETIVFRREQQGRWLACHEHLSAVTLPSP